MRLRWTLIALCACGDSAKAPVAPIVVAEVSPPPAASSVASAPPVEKAPSPSPAPPPVETTSDDEPKGNMWGDAIGDASGSSGAPAKDAGAGLGRLGNGNIQGSGSGGHPTNGNVIRSNTGTSPSLRQGATTVNGSLPPEIIQRIVRQNFGRYRLCYENGLRTNPKLKGRVTVKFTIDRSGAVSKSTDGGSDLPDKNVIACIVKGFSNLSFPQPQSGEVNVVYPIIFSPGD